MQTVEEVAARRKVRHRVEMINQDAPATCSNQVHPLVFCKTWFLQKTKFGSFKEFKLCTASLALPSQDHDKTLLNCCNSAMPSAIIIPCNNTQWSHCVNLLGGCASLAASTSASCEAQCLRLIWPCGITWKSCHLQRIYCLSFAIILASWPTVRDCWVHLRGPSYVTQLNIF